MLAVNQSPEKVCLCTAGDEFRAVVLEALTRRKEKPPKPRNSANQSLHAFQNGLICLGNQRRGSQVVRQGSAKASCVGSIPTLASKLKRFCVKVFPRQDAATGIKTGTKFSTDAKPWQTTPTRP